MTTSRLCSTRRLAFSMTISATWICREAGSSNVELMTSAVGGSGDAPLSEIGGKVQEEAVKAGYGPTIRADAVKKLVDEFQLDTRTGVGTTVTCMFGD